MRGRPICVALVIVIAGIISFYPYLTRGDKKEYRGEEKEVVCRLEAVSGTVDDRVLTVTDVMERGKPVAKRIRVYNGSGKNIFSNIQIGNILSISGEIYSFSKPGNPGQFDEETYYRETGIDYKFFAQSLTVKRREVKHLEQWLQGCRERMYAALQACLPEEDAGIVGAILLGEKCGLPKDTKKLYQENGIAHVLAISGLHISLIGVTVFYFLRKYIMPMQAAAVLTAVLLILYGIMIGFPVSATRAVTMMLCQLGARLLGKHYDALCALALSAWIQLLWQPLSLFQTGFLLSYGTVFGILVFVQEFQKLAEEKKGISVLAGSVGVQLVNLPVILYSYYEFPLYGIVANLLVLPLLGTLIGVCAAGMTVSFVSVSIGRFCMGTAHFILLIYEWVGTFFQQAPWHLIIWGRPEMWQIVCYYICLCAWLLFRGIYNKEEGRILKYKHAGSWIYSPYTPRLAAGLSLLCALLVLWYPSPNRTDGLEITNLDVGQGDCAFVQTAEGNLLIDGGSSDVKEVGEYRIVKFLKYRRIQKIDYLFLTHSDDDHVNGLVELITHPQHMGLQIGKIVLPHIRKKDENFLKLEETCRESGISTVFMERGDTIRLGKLVLQCMHPRETYEWQSENDYSLVLQVSYEDFRALFMGDLEEGGEKELLSEVSGVDYLKVAHHGSKGASSEEFLRKCKPEIAVISAGENNRYGHPHRELLERLKNTGSRVFRTDEEGAVTVKVRDRKVAVELLRKK